MLGACATAESAGLDPRLQPLQPAETGAGELELVDVHEIVDGPPELSGLSALALEADHLLLLSDRGRLFRARLRIDGDGRLTGLEGWAELPLPEPAGSADTEALALLSDGSLVIGTEDRPELLILAPDRGAVTPLPLPQLLRAKPLNEGVEALAALPDGRLLAITEGLRAGPDRVAAGLLDGASATPLAVHAPDGFQPTGADVAGSFLFVLQRRLSLLGGLEARIVALPLAALTAPFIEGRELARLGGAILGQNFEGIAVRETAPGLYRILLVSDDNASPLLRSLLAELAWRPEPAPIRPRRRASPRSAP